MRMECLRRVVGGRGDAREDTSFELPVDLMKRVVFLARRTGG